MIMQSKEEDEVHIYGIMYILKRGHNTVKNQTCLERTQTQCSSIQVIIMMTQTLMCHPWSSEMV